MNERERSTLENFLSDYAVTLSECGATTARIEKNVFRLAEAYGHTTEINIYPQHVEVVLVDDTSGTRSIRSKALRPHAIDYATITALSKLSWNCHDRHPPLKAAIRHYRRIIGMSKIPSSVVTFLTAAANASFCRLFEGDFPSMAIVFFATGCGFYLKNALSRKWHIDMRMAIVVAGCVSAMICCSGHVFGCGDTPEVALATSVLYLVPGIPYLNAVSDFINGHHICALSRLIHALIITVCLSCGLYIALLLMHIIMI